MNKQLLHELVTNGYRDIRELPTGQIAGISAMMFTCGLFVGLDYDGYERRYCYDTMRDAADALRTWDGTGDPPGPWIKEKPSDRLGPGAVE